MIKIEKYSNYETANLAIQGGLCGGVRTDQPISGLVGNAVTFATPTGTCTFTQPDGVPAGLMRFVDIKAQLEDAIDDLVVLSMDNKLCFRHATADSAVTLASLDEPARARLGLDNEIAITGRCLGGPADEPPRFVQFVTEHNAVFIVVEV